MANLKAVSYAIPSLDWNEYDHPRDPSTGEFIELGGGQFLFGKSKSAKYTTKNGEANVSLLPGDVAFQTKTGNVYVQHADGTGHLYDPAKAEASKQAVPVGGNLAKMAMGGTFKKIGENKATAVSGKDLDEAKDKIAHPEQYKNGGDDKKGPAPAGKVKVAGADVNLGAGDHAWTGMNDDMGEQEASGVTEVGVVERADGSIEYYVDGQQYNDMTPDELKAWWEDGKQDIIDGWAKVTPDPEADPEDEEHDLTAEPDEPEVSPEDEAKETGQPAPKKAAEPKPDAPAKSDDFKKKISDIVSESLKSAQTPEDAPEAPPAAETAQGDDGVLKHPVTGESIAVPEGKKVYQHKKFPNSFIFATGPDDTAPTFVNQTGKWQKKNGDPLTPPMDTFGLLEQNYNEVKAGSIGSPTPKADALKTKVEQAEAPPAKKAAAPKPADDKATPEYVKNATVGDKVVLKSGAGLAGGTWSKVSNFTWQNDDNGATMTSAKMADLFGPQNSTWVASTTIPKPADSLLAYESGTDISKLGSKGVLTFLKDAEDGSAVTMMKPEDWGASLAAHLAWAKVDGSWYIADDGTSTTAIKPEDFAKVASSSTGTYAFIYAAPEFQAAKEATALAKKKVSLLPEPEVPEDGFKPTDDASILSVLENAPEGGTITHKFSDDVDGADVYTKDAEGWKHKNGDLIPHDGFTGVFPYTKEPYTYNAPGKVAALKAKAAKPQKAQAQKNIEIVKAALPGDSISVKGTHAAENAAPMAEYVKGNNGTWASSHGMEHTDATIASVLDDDTVTVTEGKDLDPHVMEVKAEIASAKVGDGFVIQKPDGSLSGKWEKEGNGKWTNQSSGVTISPMSMMAFAEKDNLTVIPATPETDAADAKQVQSKANLAIHNKAVAEGLDLQVDFPDGPITYSMNESQSGWTNPNQPGANMPIEHMALMLQQNADKVTAHAVAKPEAGLKEWQGEVPDYISASHSNSINAGTGTAATFTHPVSGAQFQMGPGDKVHQHKKSKDSFIIASASGNLLATTFFDKNGKEKNPPAHVLAKLDTNFEVTYEAAYADAKPTVNAPENLSEGPLQDWEKALLAPKSSVTLEEAQKTTAAEQVVLTPPAPAPKKKVAQKKVKVAAKINEPKPEEQWVSPWGDKFNLLPGDEIVKIPETQSIVEHYTLLRKGKVANHYSNDGNAIYGGYITYPNIKQKVEEGEYTLVASRKDGPLDPNDFAPADIGQTTASAFRAEKDIRTAAAVALGLSPNGTYFWQDEDNEVIVNGESIRWGDATAEDKTVLMASMMTVALQAEAVLGGIAKWGPDQIDKGDKTTIGKTRNRFKRMGQFAQFAEDVMGYPDNGKTDDEMKDAFAAIHELANKGGATWGNDFPFNPSIFLAAMKTTFQQKRFTANLQDIGFDPLNGTSEQYAAYGLAEGFEFVPALDPEQQKNWVLGHLGYPNFTAHEKQSLAKAVKQAGEKIGLAQLVASLKSAAAVKAKSPQPKVIPANKTALLTLTKDLEVHYDMEDSNGNAVTLDYVGPNQWEYGVGEGSPLIFDDGMTVSTLALYADQGNLPVGSGGVAYSSGDAKGKKDLLYEKFDIADDTETDKIAGMIDSLGGSGVHLMDADERVDWIMAHVTGDMIAKHSIEKRAWATKGAPHPSNASAPGSPLSEKGKMAHKALASMLAQTPWGKDLLQDKGISSMPLAREAFDALGLMPEFDFQWGKKAADLTNGQVLEAVNKWVKYHVTPKSNKEALDAALVDLKIDLNAKAEPTGKPDGISDDIWDTVGKMTASTDVTLIVGDQIANFTDEDLNNKIANTSAAKQQGVSVLNVSAVPPNIKRMYFWGLTSDNPEADDFALALSKRIVSGDFLDEKQPVWFAPDGSKYPLAPGSMVAQKNDPYSSSDMYFIFPPKNESGGYSSHIIQWQNGSVYPQQTYMAEQLLADSKPIFTMPGTVTWAMAKSEHPEFFENAWTALENAEQKALDPDPSVVPSKVTLTAADLTYAIKHDIDLSAYPDLKAQVFNLPEKMQQYVYSLSSNGLNNDALLSMMDYKANKGVYSGMVKVPLFDPQGPLAPYISLGMTDTAGVQAWSPEAKDAYVKQFALDGEQDILGHLAKIMQEDIGTSTEGVLPDTLELKEVFGKNLGGMHSKRVWIDQNTNEWMTKAFPNDPNSDFRADVEHAANVIGRFLGFRQPQTRVQKVGGTYSYLQHLAPAVGSLSGKGPKDLTIQQLSEAMEEHVADWLTSNHDSHQDNLLMSPDGHVFGIDKGQAFKFFGKDKLAHGYLPPGNGAPVWYDKFYAQMKSGALDKETVDAVTKAVLRKALRASKADNAVLRKHLADAFSKHPQYAEGPERENYIDKIIERKNNAFNDFVDFYKGLYADSPYDFDIDTESLQKAKIGDHTHVSISQDLADDAKKTGAYGKAVFFDSTDFEDAHALISVQKAADGTDTMAGELKLRKDADATLVAWLKNQQISGGSVASQASAVPAKPDPAALPHMGMFFQKVKAGAITVNAHAPTGKTPDGAYNENTLAAMDAAAYQMKAVLAAMEQWEDTEPQKPFKGQVGIPGSTDTLQVALVTSEQHDAYKKALIGLVQDADRVQEAKEQKIKVAPHIVEPTYTPSTDLNTTGTPNAKGVWLDEQGGTWTQYDDGGWTLLHAAEGDEPEFLQKVSQNFFDKTSKHDKMEPQPIPEKEIDEDGQQEEGDGVTVTSMVGTVPVSVTKRTYAAAEGNFDPKTGQLVVSGEGNGGHHGYMYEIDFGGTRVTYMPWGQSTGSSDDGVPPSQQGLLQFKHDKWDGSSTSMEQVFNVLGSMGLDFQDANEESLELFYWRHMYGLVQDRVDGQGSGKYSKTIKAIQKEFAAKPEMTRGEELEALRKAWALSIGQDKVDNADVLPKFSRQALQPQKEEAGFTSGRPHWEHPEKDYKALHKVWNGSTPASAIKGSADGAYRIAMSGAALATEERLRVLGQWLGGMSSTSDQGYGSANFIFTRQNQNNSTQAVHYHPRVAWRTSNYSFNGDEFGDQTQKKSQSYFDVLKSADRHGGSNELLIKNAMSTMDDIAVLVMPSAAKRNEVLQHYKDLGIFTLHGLPIEEIFVSSHAQVAPTLKKIWAQVLADEKAGKPV